MNTYARVAVTTVIAALALPLVSCGLVENQDGKIREVETGRNGVKVEVQDGDDTYEVYLIPNTTCAKDDYLRDCADDDDYLVRQPGARPGVNDRSGDDDD